jgi:hypothetical protein
MRSTIWISLALLTASSAHAVDITSPGQTVPEGEKGVLQADLICVPAGLGVALKNGAKLDLNGHTLDGCSILGSGLPSEPLRLSVRGPGEIHNAGISFSAGTLRVRDVVIQDPPSGGIQGRNGINGGPSTLKLDDVTVTGSTGVGIEASRVIARHVNVSGFDEQGIIGWQSVSASHAVVTGNLEGVYSAANVRLRDSQVTGNTSLGVIANLAIAVSRSTVTGNGTDLASQIEPRVKASSCDTSLNMQTQLPWGVCAGD